MNFEAIKEGFRTYLEQKQAEKTGEYVPFDENKKISIFAHSTEFKDYLISEKIADTTISNKSLNEILSMQLKDGKLVEKEEEPKEDNALEDNNQAEGNNELPEDEPEDLMTALINDMLQDEQVISALDGDFSGELDVDEIQGYLTGIADEQGEISFDNLAQSVQNIYLTEGYKDEMYEDADVISAIDTDGDGYLSDSEKAQFEGFLKGDKDYVSLEDLENAYSAIKDGTFEYFISTDGLKDIDEEIPETEAKEDNKTKDAQNASSQGSVSYPAGNTGSGYGRTSTVKEKSLDEKTYEEMSLTELETVKPKKEKAVSDARENLAKIEQGQDIDIQSAQAKCDSAREKYLKAVETDKKIDGTLKTNISDTESAISDKEAEIISQNQLIDAQNTLIYNQNALIESDKATLSGLEAALNNLPDTSKYENDAEKKALIQTKKTELEGAIEDAKQKVSDDEKQLNKTLNPKLEELKNNLNDLENKDLKELEAKKQEYKTQMLEDCSSTTKIALQEYEEAKQELETLKQTKLQEAQKALSDAEVDLNKLNEQLNIKKSKQVERDNKIAKEGEDAVELALSYQGNNESAMKQIIRNNGYRFDDGLWCADFATYITAMTYGKDNTPGDFYNTCANTAYCPTIESWARERDVFTTDSSQVQPGDFILYTHNGRAGHVGIVVSVNEDGSVNTIEGNTYKSGQNGRYVNSHQNVKNWRGFVLMSSDKLG